MATEKPLAAYTPADSAHYWIVAGSPHKRMPLNSNGDGIVCAFCGIAYHDVPVSWSYCPQSKGALLNA